LAEVLVEREKLGTCFTGVSSDPNVIGRHWPALAAQSCRDATKAICGSVGNGNQVDMGVFEELSGARKIGTPIFTF
jgi:hypothetical protein